MRQEKPLNSAKINPSTVKIQTRVNPKGVLPIVTGITAGQLCPPFCSTLEIPVNLKGDIRKKD